MLSYEMKHAIFNKRMLISILLSFLCLIVGSADILFDHNSNIDFSYLFLFSYSCGTASLLALIYPVFACMPYGDTYAVERESGYLLYKQTKIHNVKYILIKLLSSSISGGLALSIPVACYLILCIFSRGPMLTDYGMEYISHKVQFYHSQPVLYCAGFIGNAFLCGVIFSLLALALSVFIKSRYLVLFLPLVLYILCNILCSSHLFYLNPVLWWDCNLYSESNELVVLGIELGALLLFSIIFSYGVIRNAKE